MFDKILIANRGVRACAGARSHLRAAHVSFAPDCLARAAGAGDEPPEIKHV